MAEAPSPIRVRMSQINPVIATFAAAFPADPLYCWLIPDEATRQALLPALFNFRVRYGINYGEVYATSPRAEGAAIWIPHTQTSLTKWKMLRSGGLGLLRRADKTTMQRLSVLGDYADALHHQHAPFPHWHLSPIAVHPRHQKQGHARILLRSMFDRLDREGLPCFLETQTPVNVAIYKRYGFRSVEQGTVPGTDIPHWAMLRQPQ